MNAAQKYDAEYAKFVDTELRNIAHVSSVTRAAFDAGLRLGRLAPVLQPCFIPATNGECEK